MPLHGPLPVNKVASSGIPKADLKRADLTINVGDAFDAEVEETAQAAPILLGWKTLQRATKLDFLLETPALP